jgi:hypothetical protein
VGDLSTFIRGNDLDAPEAPKEPTSIQVPTLPEPDAGLGSLSKMIVTGVDEVPAQLGLSVQKGLEREPERAARILRLQAKTGLPPDLVEENADEIERQAKAADFDPEKFRKSSPIVAQWLAEHPNNAAAAAADYSRLNFIERKWQYLKDQGSYISDRFGRGQTNTELSDIGLDAMLGKVTPEQRKRQAEIEQHYQTMGDHGISGFWETLPGDIAEQLPIFGNTLAGKAKATAVGATGGALVGSIGGLPGAIASGSVGARVGWKYGGAVEAAKMEGGLAYLDFEKMKDENGLPLDQATITGAAAIVGAANGALEMVGFEAIAKRIPVLKDLSRSGVKKLLQTPTTRAAFMQYAKGVGSAVLAEGGTESMQELVKNLGGIFSKSYQDGSLDGLTWDKALENVAESGVQGAKSGGGMVAVGSSIEFAGKIREGKRVQANKEALNQIVNQTAESKLKASSPEAAAQVTERLAGQKTFHIPIESWDAYWQKQVDDDGNPVDPAEVFAEVVGDRKAYEEAKAIGADLPIPAAKYIDKVANRPEHHVGLQDEIRTDPDQMTPREWEEYKKKADAEEKAAAEAESAPVDSSAPQAPDPVAEAVAPIVESLRKSGVYSEEQLKAFEPFVRERLKIRSDVRGQSVDEMMREFPLAVQSMPEMPKSGMASAQPKAADPNLTGDEFLQRAGMAATAKPVQVEGGVAPASVRVASAASLVDGAIAAKEAMPKGSFKNAHTGWTIGVASRGESKLADGSVRSEDIQAATVLDQLIENAVYVGTQANDNKKNKRTIPHYHVFYAPMRSNGKDYLVRLKVRETTEGKKYYHEVAVESERPTGTSTPSSLAEPENRGAAFSEPSEISIAEFISSLNATGERHIWFQNDADGNPSASNGLLQDERSGPRGAITRMGDLITIFTKRANVSTVIHELGHRFLIEIEEDIKFLKGKDQASLTDQQKKFLDDGDKILEYLGIKSWDELKEEHHEKWARTVEQYTRTGKAPSAALVSAFNTFRRWMNHIYRAVKNLPGVDINPEIKGVMDRLLATEEQIAQVQAEQEMRPVFQDQAASGLNDEQWAAYQKAREEFTLAAENHFAAKVLAEREREQAKAWKEEKSVLVEKLTSEYGKLPVYQAISVMRTGKLPDGSEFPRGRVRMLKSALVQRYGDESLTQLKGLHVGKASQTSMDGVHPDSAAEVFGFSSGDEMVAVLRETEPLEARTEREATEQMKAKYGDLLSDPKAMRAEALKAAYNEKHAAMLRFELEHLTSNNLPVLKDLIRTITRRLPPAQEMREWARDVIGSKKVADIDPNTYQRAAAKAAREAGIMLAKGDVQGAFDAKLKEARNAELFRQATAAQERIETIEDYTKAVQKMARRQRLGKVGQEWLAQFETILVRFGFRDSATEPKRTLMDWLDTVHENEGEDIAVAAVVLNANSSHYTDISFDDLEGVYDTLRSIEHIARKLTEIDYNGKKIDRAELAALFAGQVVESLPNESPLAISEADISQAQNVWEKTKGFLATNLRPEKIMERIDHGKKGIAHDILWNKAVDAENKKNELLNRVLKPLTEFTANMDKGREARMNEVVYVKALDRSLTRRTLMGMALNTGNYSNRLKLMEGGLWVGKVHQQISDVALAEILNKHLNADDGAIIQKIWDSIGLLYPDLNELNERAVGLPLNKIPASPVLIGGKEFPGGYWPAVGDPRHSRVGERQEDSDAMMSEIFGAKNKKAATSNSFRKERTSAAYPLQLDWQRVLSNHVHKAITDIAYHEWVKDARRLLDATPVKKALQNHLGEVVYKGMHEWLVHQVQPAQGGYSANNPIDWVSNTLLSNTAVAALGLNVATALGNAVLAPVQASHQVRADYMLRGMGKYLSNPRKALEAVHELSGQMKYRKLNLDQTYNQLITSLAGKNTVRAKIALWSMAIHAAVDQHTSTSLWLGKYQQEIDQGSSPNEAIRAADKMVRTTQTAGGAKDLSSFERDSRYKIFKMFIGPMIIMQNEMRGAVAYASQQETTAAGKAVAVLKDPKVFATAMATWIIPSVLYDIVVGRGPGEDEDKEAWAMRKMLLYPAMTVPFVRDAAASVEQALGGKKAISRSHPIADTIGSATRAFGKAMSENATDTDTVEAFARAMGPLVGLPTNAAIKASRLVNDKQ